MSSPGLAGRWLRITEARGSPAAVLSGDGQSRGLCLWLCPPGETSQAPTLTR